MSNPSILICLISGLVEMSRGLNSIGRRPLDQKETNANPSRKLKDSKFLINFASKIRLFGWFRAQVNTFFESNVMSVTVSNAI